MLLIKTMADLSSETMVLLGSAKLSEEKVKEELRKNHEWQKWKEDRNITDWKPKAKSVQKKTKTTTSVISSKKNSPIMKIISSTSLKDNVINQKNPLGSRDNTMSTIM